MITFTLWLLVGGHWFLGPDFHDLGKCEAAAAEIRVAARGATVVCGPRGMP